jgi:hypothetical protein
LIRSDTHRRLSPGRTECEATEREPTLETEHDPEVKP